LAATGDASLATIYQQALGDQSYAVIDEAAEALGKTKSASAYDALTRLLDQRSWRDRVRIAALRGLAELGDRRALEIGLRYAQPDNPMEV
ncbi:HEAT repeat domain-containing protein, partial [Acinetobacter baumannii]